MSFYINCHNGLTVNVDHDTFWVNIVFLYDENFLMRSDSGVLARVLERLKERRFAFADVPWDREIKWCISLPVSRRLEDAQYMTSNAIQLAEWYLEQIRLGNVTVNRDALLDMKSYHPAVDPSEGTVYDRIAQPDGCGPAGSNLNAAIQHSHGGSTGKTPFRRKRRLHK